MTHPKGVRVERQPIGEEVMSRIGSGSSKAGASDEFVAGNGLIHRRALLRGGVMLAGAAGVGAASTGAAAEPLQDAEWSRYQGGNVQAYATRSRFEKETLRILSNPNGEPRTQHARVP